MQAIADEKQRILLTLATGTGKTFIAFQIAWKLFHARWNLSGQSTRRPRILFLADRNILANQAHALLVRDLINQLKTSKDPNYCQRVTADDGERGEQWLRDFQDNE